MAIRSQASAAGLSHDNYGPQLVVLSCTFVLAATLFLTLHILLKINHRRGLW
jgi:hypothetical protein